MKLHPYPIIFAVLATLPAGCAIQRAESEIRAAQRDLQELFAKQTQTDKKTGAVKPLGRIYLGSQVVASRPEIPEKLEHPGIVIERLGTHPYRTVQEIARDLQWVTGLQVSVDGLSLSPESDQLPAQKASGGDEATPAAAPSPAVQKLIELASPATAPQRTNATATKEHEPTNANECLWEVSFKGPLSRFLDRLASQCDVEAEITDNGIHIFRYVTYTERLSISPSSIQSTSSVSGVGGQQSLGGFGATASGGSAQSGGSTNGAMSSTSRSADLDQWAELTRILRAVLPTESRLEVAPGAGVVVITARKEAAERAVRIVREEQRWQSLYVIVTGKLIALRESESDNYGFTLEALWRSSGFGTAWVGPAVSAGADAAGIRATVIGVPQDRPESRFNGTDAIVNALSQAGLVLDQQDVSGVAMNNRAAPLQNGQDIPFTAGTQSTAVGVSGVVTTRIPGLATVGLSARLVPRISRELVTLGITLTQSNVLDFVEEGSGDNFTRRPLTSRVAFDQDVPLKDGQTIIIGGFDRVSRSVDRTGVGTPWNILAGGSLSGNIERAQLYLVLTVRVVDPLAE